MNRGENEVGVDGVVFVERKQLADLLPGCSGVGLSLERASFSGDAFLSAQKYTRPVRDSNILSTVRLMAEIRIFSEAP